MATGKGGSHELHEVEKMLLDIQEREKSYSSNINNLFLLRLNYL
jgi:hypothetical protein